MMRPSKRLLSGAAVIASALTPVACGDDDEDERAGGETGTGTEAAAPEGEPVATVELAESDFEIDPKDPKIDKSGVIRFSLKNTGQVEHALEVETPEGESETEPFGPGETATLEVELQPGTYTMYCPVGDHEQRGMKGTVTVAGGGGGGGQGTTEEDDRGGGDPGSDAHGGY